MSHRKSLLSEQFYLCKISFEIVGIYNSCFSSYSLCAPHFILSLKLYNQILHNGRPWKIRKYMQGSSFLSSLLPFRIPLAFAVCMTFWLESGNCGSNWSKLSIWCWMKTSVMRISNQLYSQCLLLMKFII